VRGDVVWQNDNNNNIIIIIITVIVIVAIDTSTGDTSDDDDDDPPRPSHLRSTVSRCRSRTCRHSQGQVKGQHRGE